MSVKHSIFNGIKRFFTLRQGSDSNLHSPLKTPAKVCGQDVLNELDEIRSKIIHNSVTGVHCF